MGARIGVRGKQNRLNECQFTPQHVTPLSFLTGKRSHSLELKRGHLGLKI